jgi:hypothetical protein
MSAFSIPFAFHFVSDLALRSFSLEESYHLRWQQEFRRADREKRSAG